MSINSNEGQNPDQSNSYGGGYGGYQASSSAQQPYDPNDPYADHSGQGTYAGYDQQQSSSGQQQQQQQEQTFYQPPESATRRQRTSASSSSASTMKMAPNKAAIFSYALGWVSGLIFLVMERKNSFVRFSAAQSFLFFGSVSILQIIISALSHIPLLGVLLAPILGLVSTVVTAVALAAWLFLMFQASRGVKVKIPVVGDYAEALVARFTR